MRALLMSSSITYEDGLLGHAAARIGQLVDSAGPLVFVPYALRDWDAYTESVRLALADVCDVSGVHTLSAAQAVQARAFYVGGGNTFRLLRTLQDTALLA